MQEQSESATTIRPKKEPKGSASFRIKVPEKDLEQMILQNLILDGIITEREKGFFIELTRHGRNTMVEFVVN
jgi:hypothetical protein